jgi:hypothetical protein
MEAALKSLGFTEVIKVLNGNLEQMENAVLNLSRKLGSSQNTYGFFFFLGHGVQSNGEDYLIPVEANNILNESHLRTRTVPLDFIMTELNRAGNELNMIVLDSCRDNPFGWSRSANRGLSVISNAPSGSMVFYATATGARADDGSGRNGLFTGQLLNNLKKPGLSIRDVFERTGADVMSVSNGTQKPELADSYFRASSAYLGPRPVQPEIQVQSDSQFAGQTYKIGDTGPAGGIIFYDKGNTADGWRYLEAAPTDSEFTAEWGGRGKNIPGTMTAVGSGKLNTQIIVDKLKGYGETSRAAQRCAALDINGYKDWFLSSKDELDLMYKNLKRIGLGNFGNGWYWSSSQLADYSAWNQSFRDGFQRNTDHKNSTYSVRAIRAF